MRFSIYRFDPDTDASPYMKDYELALEAGDMMLLDALILIKVRTIRFPCANPAGRGCAGRMR